MRYLMFTVIVAVMLAWYLSSVHILPPAAKFAPEVLSAIVAAYVAVAGTQQRFRNVEAKYWLIFGALALVIACGAAANHEAPGPIVSGMRYYLRPIPMFFIPAVCDFSERQIKEFMRLLLGLSLLQVPVAMWQRFYLLQHFRSSGDTVYGTIMLSGTLTLFLICVMAVLGAMTLRQLITKATFIKLFLLLLIPMSINETKVTVIVLPLAVLMTFFLGSPPAKRIQSTFAALFLLIGASAVFVPLYDYFNTVNSADPFTIEDFFSNKSSIPVANYLSTGSNVGNRREAGRADALIVPAQEFAHDPVKFAFGLGLGNVSKSSLGLSFTGDYYALYGKYGSSAGIFIFETGFLGFALILTLHGMIFRDSLVLARHDGLMGAVAVGWATSVVIATIGLFYLPMHIFESFSYMFWFFSGLVAATRTRLAASNRSELRPDKVTRPTAIAARASTSGAQHFFHSLP